MKKSFYELYLEKQKQKNDSIIIEKESPKIRSPNRRKIIISYYLWQIVKFIFYIIVCFLATIGCITIITENIRNQVIELLLSSSFLIF